MHAAVILVGHANWGKSKTLKALTKGVIQYRYYDLAGRKFYIRRMSNDDRPDMFTKFINRLPKISDQDLLLTLCPDFTYKKACTEHALKRLLATHGLYFFVLKHSYTSKRSVSDDEIRELRRYGAVQVFDRRNCPADARALALEEYVVSLNLPCL